MTLASKLAEERRARLAAERLLELKQAELFAANRKLGQHAKALQGEVVETRAQVASVRDENKRVKAELGVATEKAEKAEQRLWHSIDTIQDGFAYFNADNEMIAANHAYLDMFDGLEMIRPGVNYVTILQMLTEEGIVNTEDHTATQWRQQMLEHWMQTAPEPITVRLWNNHYMRFVDRRGANGDVVSLALDITDSVAYEKQLKRARTEAEAANRAKSAFLANMSHEIRTPMNGVVGMAELLGESELDEEQLLYVETIRNSGEALLVIINDVLDYSKIEAEKLQLKPEPFDLERCIHDVIRLLLPSASDKGLNLLLDFDLFLPTGYIGDPGRFRQILTNLLGNAVKFTQEGYVLVRVTGIIDPENKSSRVTIAVEDTGIGIPADKIDHIFGEFNQVENERNRKFDGTGLGLAITQRLVGLMGGEIWLTSEEGVGSCFGLSVDLPFSGDALPQHPRLPDGLRRVMVVDDLEVNRQILEHQLMQLGVGVIAFASPKEAVDEYDGGVDLVLTEHTMMEMDGLELAAALRAKGSKVPILLLSANPRFAHNDPAHAELVGILQKPYSREDLFKYLENIPLDDDEDDMTGAVPETDSGSRETLAQAFIEDNERDAAQSAGQGVSPDVAPALDAEAEDPPAQPETLAEPEVEATDQEVVAAEPEVVAADPEVEAAEPEVVAADPEPPAPTAPPAEEPAVAEAPEAEDVAPADDFVFLSSRRRRAEDRKNLTPPPEPVAAETVQKPEDPAGPDIAIDAAPPAVAGPIPEPHAELQAQASAEPAPPDDPSEEASFESRQLRVLAAEDNKTNQLVFRKMLQTLDLDLKFAVNGEEAVALYQSFQPDMIFMDISMPKMDGKEAATAIRALETGTGAHIPIIAMTAHAMEGDDKGILEAGIDYYLSKPLRKPLIHEKIRTLCPDDVRSPEPAQEKAG